jgi:hypothetical protein
MNDLFRRFGLARRRLILVTVALALAAFGLGSGASVASTAGASASVATASSAANQECITSAARVKGGSDGADPNSLTLAEAAAVEREINRRSNARNMASRSQSILPGITIDVRVHVITRNNGTGGVSLRQVQRQINVLNRAFAGRTAGQSSATPFRFALRSVDYTRNTDWYEWSSPDVSPDDDREAKRALHRGGWDDLNIYIAGLEDDLLGYATFPFDTNLRRDGVVLLNDSLPGGSASPYNLGDTATHEVGHWLGLYHTFQGGCRPPGDYVTDTPYQANGDNIFECDESLNTCRRQPGRDPVHNFMSYGDDLCLDRFSPGQAVRMTLIWKLFRDPSLLP